MAEQRRTITITPELVTKWESEAEELQQKIDTDTAKLRLIKQRLDALSLFSDEEKAETAIGETETQRHGSGFISLSLSPPAFVRSVLRSTHGPITVSQLRDHIERSGYLKERFGKNFSYLYTILGRMSKAGEIMREGEKLWLARR